MPKIIRILRSCSMKIFCQFPIVNISKLNFWLVICIAKNFIWTNLKVIFSIFRFFCTLRFQIYKYCPIITNHTSMESLFIQLSDDVYISISKNWPLWLALWSRVTYMVYKHYFKHYALFSKIVVLFYCSEEMCISNIFAGCALLWPQERSQKLFFPLTEIMPFKFEYNSNIDNI